MPWPAQSSNRRKLLFLVFLCGALGLLALGVYHAKEGGWSTLIQNTLHHSPQSEDGDDYEEIEQSDLAQESSLADAVTVATKSPAPQSRYCSNADRMALRNQVCREILASDNQTAINLKHKVIEWILADNVHRAVYIIIPKAGSRSWFDFFSHSIGEHAKIETKRAYFRRLGIDFTSLIPIAEMNRRYANYTKFIVVRHPLQKFVSGYYEVMVHRRKYRDQCVKIRTTLSGSQPETCKKNPTLNFHEFSRAFSKGYLPENEHWSNQLHQGKACRSNLNLILKSETDERDVRFLSSILNLTATRSHITHVHSRNQKLLSHATKNKISPDLTKYDSILKGLQKQHPDTFDWLLDYFGADLRMFGYTWNSGSGSSGCSSLPVNKCC